jgi:hypothetical protein
MTTEERRREDTCVLLNYILPDLTAAMMLGPEGAARPPHIFIGDGALVQEFKKFFDTRSHSITMAFVFAIRLQLDTLYIRREAGINDLLAMRKTHNTIRTERSDFVVRHDLKFQNNMDNYFQNLSAQNHLHELQMATDMLYQFKVRDGWTRISPKTVKQDTLWSLNPWCSCNAISYALLDFWEYGVMLCSGAGFVQSSMHLWNLLQQSGYLSYATDEGLLLNHLTRVLGKQVFMGTPPQQNFYARWLILLGWKPEALAAQRRTHTRWNPALGEYTNFHARHPGGRGVVATDSEVWKLHTSNHGVHLKTGKWDNILAPLEYVRGVVEKELNGMLNLNFYRIHLLCVELFRALFEEIKSDLSLALRCSEAELLDEEGQLPFVTGWVMMVVEEWDKEGKSLKNSGILAKCAGVVKRMLAGAKAGEYLLDLSEVDRK